MDDWASMRTVAYVHTSVSRHLARAENVPYRIQRLLWCSGDSFARSALASLQDLDPTVEEWILAERDDRLIASWARSRTRRATLVDQACSWVTDEMALISLAGLAPLSTHALGELVTRATPMVATRLLERDDLPDLARAALVGRYLSTVDSTHSGAGRVLLEKFGESPTVWAEVVRQCWPAHVGLLSSIPSGALDDPEVQEQVLRLFESTAPESLRSARFTHVFQRVVKSLAASATLPLDDVERLLRIVSDWDPDLLPLVERRRAADVPALLGQALCVPGRECAGSAEHVDALRALLGAVSFVSLPLTHLFVCGVRHLDALDKDVFSAAAAQLRGDAGRSALTQLESAYGPGSPELVAAVRLLGLWPASALSDPVPTMRVLAQQGWEQLARAYQLPVEVLEVVAWEFAPATDLLADSVFAELICRRLEPLDEQATETALALLGEWSGSLRELVECSRVL